jgi:hypothetical protein
MKTLTRMMILVPTFAIGLQILFPTNHVGAQSGAPDHQDYVLGGGDYTFVGPGQPVDCPPVGGGCKSEFYSTKPLTSPAGTVITAVEVLLRKPERNNHWYRCEVVAACGVAEFSDIKQPNKSCIGTPACLVWRATDGARGEDTIRVSWRRADSVAKEKAFFLGKRLPTVKLNP